MTNKLTSLPWGKPSFWVVVAIITTLASSFISFIVDKVGQLLNLENAANDIAINQYGAAITFLFIAVLFGGWHALKDKPRASKWLFYAAAGVTIVSGFVWLTFGNLPGGAFNPVTGEPLHMYDPSTGKIDKKFTPVECRPAGTAHKGYNYATYDKCFSDNGTKLLPITHEVATRLTPSAWPAMVSDWWSSDSEDKEVKQTSSQAPIPETKRPGTVIPVGVPVNITVPACQTGIWSNKISIPVGWNITSGWNMRVVKAQWRENGIWKEFSHKNLNGSFDAVRYCAKINSYAGDAMSLTWTPQ